MARLLLIRVSNQLLTVHSERSYHPVECHTRFEPSRREQCKTRRVIVGPIMTDRFYPPARLSLFRKMAAVSWDAPGDPTIYGATEVDATELVQWLANQSEGGAKLSVTHAVARAMAAMLAEHADLNCTIRRGKIYRRRDVDVFVQVAAQHTPDCRRSWA